MADVSDVEAAIVTAVAGALFPGTTYVPGAMQALPSGPQALVLRGWPNAAELDIALAAGQSYVTIFPQANSSRDTTRYQALPSVVSTVPITFAATITPNGQSVSFTGTCTAGQVVGLVAGGIGYAYRMTNSDTPATVAAAFAALIPGATSGPVTNFTNGANLYFLPLIS
jgi:hypothetical protein